MEKSGTNRNLLKKKLTCKEPDKYRTLFNEKFVFKALIAGTFFLLLLNHASIASQVVSEVYDRALFEILNLKPKTAKKILDTYKNPKFDIYKESLLNWSDVIELTLTEDKERYNEYLESLDLRMERIEKQADKSSESYHINIAEIYAHAALVNIFYGDYLSGFGKLMKANKNARLNETKYPEYWQNNKLCGTLNVSLATLSPFWKKVAGIFSFTGDLNKGLQQLSTYINEVKDSHGLKSEALLYYGAALKIAKDEEQAYELLSKHVIKEEAPALVLYLTSNVLYQTNRNEEALAYLQYFPKKQIEITFNHFDYLMGKEKLNRLDPETQKYFYNFLGHSEFNNYSREICLKMAHFYFINSDTMQYRKYLKKIDDCPKAAVDRDREADIEKNKPYLPHSDLLKTRYLVNGGYYSDAAAILNKIKIGTLIYPTQKNEYYVLVATVQNSQNKNSEALQICDQLIQSGINSKDQFAAEAALLAGNICLQQDNLKRAEVYFNKTLEIDGNDDVYMEHIHKKAKNQLNKIKSKAS